MYYLEPEQDTFSVFLESYPADKAVVMLNLLRFHERAQYAEDAGEEPCSGLEAFLRYGAAVGPMIESRGGSQVWQGRPAAMLIGPDDKDWHLAVLVRYPSARTFVDMVTSEDYQAIMHHRQAALLDSRLIAHEEL